MPTKSSPYAAILAFVMFCTPSVSDADCPQDLDDCHFSVLTAEFESSTEGNLGANVALALQHQIFRTFLVSIPANPADICCFPRDTIAVLETALADQTRDEALRRGRLNRASTLVLWGSAWPWRDYVVVQPYLTVVGPPRGLNPMVEVCCTNTTGVNRRRPFTAEGSWNIWEISAEASNESTHSLSIERFPRTFYELPQISLDPEGVAKFRSLAGLAVYDDIGGQVIPGARTTNLVQADQHVGEWTRIADPNGWIRLPTVDAGPLIEFVGGLFHFFRGNWERAEPSLRSVMGDESAHSTLRVDAALLLAATLYRLDPACAECADVISIAESINPFSGVTARFKLMSDISAAVGPADYAELLKRLDDKKSLFPEADPFSQRARQFLTSMAGSEP